MTTHDQRFKNLTVDYPRDALRFFAAEAQHIDDTVRFIPIRQEQLQKRFGERFRELDTPIWVEWPDDRREILLGPALTPFFHHHGVCVHDHIIGSKNHYVSLGDPVIGAVALRRAH